MRNGFLPYCLPDIGEHEIQSVIETLRSGWITTGPKVKEFEEAFRRYTGAAHAVAVSSCTAALHLSLAALGIGPGDEVLVPTLTFCATANVVVHLGARPVLVDVDRHGLFDPELAEAAITQRTKAIIPVHYAGQPCEMDRIEAFASRYGLHVIEDAAHAVGASYQGRKIGVHSTAVAFSFYATKNMTTGEGGMVTTSDGSLAERIRCLALHGMSRDAWRRYSQAGHWYYEVLEPGYKYNMTDLQAALGLPQLDRLDAFIDRRRQIARRYEEAFRELEALEIPVELPGRTHVYHLYPVRICDGALSLSRAEFIEELKRAGIGSGVHFIPLHRHPYYRKTFGYLPEEFPSAERLYRGLVSLPLYPRMKEEDVEDVIRAVLSIVRRSRTRAVAGYSGLTPQPAAF